jgi:hypothetical protein
MKRLVLVGLLLLGLGGTFAGGAALGAHAWPRTEVRIVTQERVVEHIVSPTPEAWPQEKCNGWLLLLVAAESKPGTGAKTARLARELYSEHCQ